MTPVLLYLFLAKYNWNKSADPTEVVEFAALETF